MPEIIDLSQEIFPGMPVFSGHPPVQIELHIAHEGAEDAPAVNRLVLGEHTGTHVDALSHMNPGLREQSIENMPLTMFYTEGICLDLSHRGPRELIEKADLLRALSEAGQELRQGDTVLLYTDHYRRVLAQSSNVPFNQS